MDDKKSLVVTRLTELRQWCDSVESAGSISPYGIQYSGDVPEVCGLLRECGWGEAAESLSSSTRHLHNVWMRKYDNFSQDDARSAVRLLRRFVDQILPGLAANASIQSDGPPDGFRPVSELMATRDELKGSFTKARAAVEAGSMRTWKPTRDARRLFVHAGDWLEHWNNVDAGAFDAMDSNSDAIAAFIDGAEKRRAAIPKKPNRERRDLPKK